MGGFEEKEAEEFCGVFEDEVWFFEENLRSINEICLLSIPKFGIFFGISLYAFSVVIFLFDIFPN